MSGKTRCVIRLSLDGGTLAGLLMDAHMKYLPCPSPSLIDGWPRCPGHGLRSSERVLCGFIPSLTSGGPPAVYGLALMPRPHVRRHEHSSLSALWYWHHCFWQLHMREKKEGGSGCHLKRDLIVGQSELSNS